MGREPGVKPVQWRCQHFSQPVLMCQLGVHWAACNGKSHEQWGWFFSRCQEFWPG